MKRKHIPSLILSLTALVCTTATFAIDAGDNFDSDTVDPTKWGADTTIGNGRFVQQNNRLEYLAQPSTAHDEADRPWILTQFPTTNDWDIILEVRCSEVG